MTIFFLPMLRRFVWLSLAGLFPVCALACSCMGGGHSACGEVTGGTAVFTARVLSVSPPFLNRLNPANRTEADRVNQFYEQLDSTVPGQSLQSLKNAFRELLPGLSPDQNLRLSEANSRQALLRLFELVFDRGSYVTLEVKTVFSAGHDDDDDAKAPATPADKATPAGNKKGGKDDDHDGKPGTKNVKAGKAKANDEDDDSKAGGRDAKAKTVKAKDDDDDRIVAGKITAVWTPNFDCGVEFQVGETYLVYASMDEDSDMAETDTCMGTRRLSDAGADLPYLSFVKTNPEESTHLDGFVTTDRAASANPPEGDRIPEPLAGALVELKSEDALRYATSNNEGRFVFDGLAGGSYRIAAYASETPSPNRVMATPRELTIAPKTCARYVVLAQPTAPDK